ncbi:hypothetical protein MMC11_004280 [Xylographa trunciseda]|nr:hypothetical protein [Xylographa trunciseda]
MSQPFNSISVLLRKLAGLNFMLSCLLLFSAFNVVVCLSTAQIPLDPVNEVLKRVPLIDGHNDFPIWIRAFYQNKIYNFTETSSIDGQVDFPRLRKGRLRGQFWSTYVPCPVNDTDFSDEAYSAIVHDTLQQIDLVNRLLSAFPSHLCRATSSESVWSNFATSSCISSLMGAEGLHQIGNSASILRLYHALGMRYITLTHDCHNRYADAANQAVPLHHGLSAAGLLLLREMNRVGMVIDLSHTSAETMRAALMASRAPVMFSHSSAYTLCPHPRNVPDDVLAAVKKNGGVVMVSFYPEYTYCENPQRASLSDVADHIQYIGNLIGYEHVGLGSDFDGMAKGPSGLEDVSLYPALIREVIGRGVTHAHLEGLVGRNILRVLKEVEETAKKMVDVLPLEDTVKPFFDS